MRNMLFLTLVLLLVQHGSSQLIYNTTQCKEIAINDVNFPKHPPYSLSIASSTYEAGRPLTIEVESCEHDGFKAFMLQATITGKVLTNGDPSKVRLGEIYVTCGSAVETPRQVIHEKAQNIKHMSFRWIPPSRSSGNITFHLTAVPQSQGVYWLAFSEPKQDHGDGEARISVTQVCSSSQRWMSSSLTVLMSTVLLLFFNTATE